MLAIVAIAPKERQRIAPGVNPWEEKRFSHKKAQKTQKNKNAKKEFSHGFTQGGIAATKRILARRRKEHKEYNKN